MRVPEASCGVVLLAALVYANCSAIRPDAASRPHPMPKLVEVVSAFGRLAHLEAA
ncbi:MAG: hypothetical protein ACRD0G_14765 [Acidimicrobiales bacterium]